MKPSLGFMLYLAGLSMLGFLATDMYLPAFSAMQTSLMTSPGMISASLSIFLGGFAIGQLLWGPLSDKIGRKPVLLIGLALFVVGCLGVLWVENVRALLALRFLQAVGVCAAAVTWQALVVDRFSADVAKKPLPASCRWLRFPLLWHLYWAPGFSTILTGKRFSFC